jgi:hypothetical protein
MFYIWFYSGSIGRCQLGEKYEKEEEKGRKVKEKRKIKRNEIYATKVK